MPGILMEDVDSALAARAEAGPGAFVGLLALEDYLARPERRVYTLRAEARTESGATFVREAVVEVTGDAGRPFAFYAWRRGERATPQNREAE